MKPMRQYATKTGSAWCFKKSRGIWLGGCISPIAKMGTGIKRHPGNFFVNIFLVTILIPAFSFFTGAV